MTKPRPASWILAALVFFTACLFGPRAPDVPPRGTLALGDADGGAGKSEGPFGIVFGAPRGQTVDPSEITLVFNRPMRPLDLAGSEAPAPVQITPKVPGAWQWVGTTGVVFVPEGHLPRATEFVVEVPQGTKALDGSVLEKAYRLKFSTARPSLERVDTKSSHHDLRPESTFTLRFNQPVADAEMKSSIALTAGGKTGIPFEVRRPDPKSEMLAELVPRVKLPLDSPVSLRVQAKLKGREGSLPAGADKTFDFKTYGPLLVTGVQCSTDTPTKRCAASSGFSVRLTNRVKAKELRRALSIQPAVKIAWPSWMSDDDVVTGVPVSARFVPGATYRVTLQAGIKDEHGQPLARTFSEPVVFDDLWPVAEIGLVGNIFEPVAQRAIPVARVNVADLELTTARLDEKAILSLVASRRSGHVTEAAAIRAASGAKLTKLPAPGAKNRPATHLVEPNDVLGGSDKRGPIGIAISYTDKPGTRWARSTSRSRIVQVTDLGVSAKVSPNGSIVWVTRLSTGAPVQGATVSILRHGGPAESFTTDVNGFALVPKSSFRPERAGGETGVVFARHQGDWTYKEVDTYLRGYRFGVSIDFSEDRPFGLLFTDRGIYRPGDTVRIKGMFRQESHPGTSTPVGRTVNVSVAGPDGEPLAKPKAVLSAFGTMSFDVKVPETGRLGTYSIHATVEGSPREYPDAAQDFEVAEYRPSEFKVSASSSQPSFVRGDKAVWTARGDYLFGAPMSGSEARMTITRSETWFMPPGLDGFTVADDPFVFGRPEAPGRTEAVHAGAGQLDAKGEATVATALALPGQRKTELVTFEAEVSDLSRQALAGSTSAIVHPGEFYVGLRPGADVFVKAGEPVKPEVVAADPKGARVAGVPVQVELVRRTWSVAKQAVGGGFRSETVPVDQVVASCTVTTAAGAEACSLRTGGAGYYLVHATAKDKRQNPLSSAYSFYATGEGETSWGDNDKLQVELVPDRKSYEVGQTARVLVKSPWKNAEAFITVERAGVYTKRRTVLAGGMPTIDVPITDEIRPNAFVSVLLVRGRSKAPPAKMGAADVGAPAFRVGYASLPVNPEARRLSVSLKPNKSDFKPGEGIEVEVGVKDRAGKPARAEVTLYAVDEGVLSLIGYKTPDPVPIFGAARALKVATIETREGLARVMNPFGDLGLDKGFDGGGGGLEPGVRRDFRASAYYNPVLVTDANGRAKVSFKLPDGLTTYRIMAVTAAEDDRFGYAEERVTTSRPLMARPALPRFLRAGDQIDAGVIVTSKGLAKSRIQVELTAVGLTPKGATRQAIDLDANTSAEVRFALVAEKTGKATLRFKAEGGGSSDVVEVTRTVSPPQVLEAVALYGDTTQASAEKLGDLSAMRSDVGGLEVSLASTALVGLGGGVEQLVEYPYGCTEQLTSRLVPLIPLRELAADFKLKLPPDLDRIVKKAVVDILAHQRGDGGFGLWKESTETSAWVTAYALWGLSTAKKRGVDVPASSLDSATRYLRGALERMDKDPVYFATAPFILDVLAENGSPDPGRVTRLFEQREKLPLFSRALLLHAMVLSKNDKKGITELVGEIEGHVRIDGPTARAVSNHGDRYAVLMDSDARTSALVLRGFLAARPNHALGARLAKGLLADRKGGRWRTTQETAWALLALDQYRRVQEAAVPDFQANVFLGAADLFSAEFRERTAAQPSKTIPAANLMGQNGAPLSFSVDGTGRLFYEARLRYARKRLPDKPLERGFYVKKTLRPVLPGEIDKALRSGSTSSVTSYRGGDLVLAELVVVSPSPRNFVVIDDPLPAGFEAIDMRLATTAGSLDLDAAAHRAGQSDGDDDSDDQVAKGAAYRPSHFIREVRDDRVLFFVDHLAAGMYRYRYLARATTLGTFVLPPTKAEEMYTPEVFGRTAAAVIQVAPK